MRWVETPAVRPNHCAAIPFVTNDPEGFIDTGSELDGYDNHVYVSVTAIREMARMIGYQHPADVAQLERELRETREELQVAQVKLAEQERHLVAIDVLASAGFTARKKPGRPKREEEARAA